MGALWPIYIATDAIDVSRLGVAWSFQSYIKLLWRILFNSVTNVTHMAEDECDIALTDSTWPCVEIYDHCPHCESNICGRCLKLIMHHSRGSDKNKCPNCGEELY